MVCNRFPFVHLVLCKLKHACTPLPAGAAEANRFYNGLDLRKAPQMKFMLLKVKLVEEGKLTLIRSSS